jgi:hypothetical protein
MNTNTVAVKKPSPIHAVAANVVPYVKELRLLKKVGSVNACILMRQLEYWFERHPDEFYKFLSPPAQPHRAYQTGKSWTEELGFSEDEFRTAFDLIGVRYKSKKLYDAAGSDKFGEKYYCSYTDKLSHMTYYYRNHVAVDSALNWLANRELYAYELSETELYPSEAGNWERPGSRDGNGQSSEVDRYDSDYKETTTETTTENKTDNSLSIDMGGEKFSLPSDLSKEFGDPVLSQHRPYGGPESVGNRPVINRRQESQRGRVTTLDDLTIDRQLEEEFREWEFDLESELTYFQDYCQANDRYYADYRSGFKSWLNKKIEHNW